MIASGSRPGLDIPFVEMEPVLHDIPLPHDSYPDLGTLEPGALIAERYRVIRKIAEGGMGVLYACDDTVLFREVAVKLMQRAIAADPLLAERLMREARLAAQLRKHVAQVFDCGMLPTGEPYIVMELLHGRDLYNVLKESGPLTPEAVVGYMLEVCVGLAEAHEKGIIHRDLKPENLYCADEPDGSVVLKIVDFGVSKQLTSRRMRTQTNPTESVGSPQYMSPEQITTPSEVDPRTDIWSLGVVMFELLTGSVPFNGAGPAQVCASVLTEPVPPFSDYRDDVPPALEAIVLRCLQRERERRFANVAELSAALTAFRTSDEAEPEDERALDSLKPSFARRSLSALLALSVLAGCGIVLGMAVREGRIRLPMAADIERLPARISAWHLPLLSPAPAAQPGPTDQSGPTVAPNVPVEQRPQGPESTLAPTAVAPAKTVSAPVAPASPLTHVQVKNPAPMSAGNHGRMRETSSVEPGPTPYPTVGESQPPADSSSSAPASPGSNDDSTTP